MNIASSEYAENVLQSVDEIPPPVSVIIPCRNEVACIARCLDSLLSNDYPMNQVEILVVDGLSVDGTADVVQSYMAQHPNVFLVRNDKRTIPAAMNLGITHSTGYVVMKADAHAAYPADFIRQCIHYLMTCRDQTVGGVLAIIPRNESLIARTIALALSDRFGSGSASVRVGAADLRYGDAAAFGCWKRTLFDEIGLFDERLVRNSDMEHNKRILASGGRILLVPHIKITYYADADLWTFWKHNLGDGFWAVYAWKFGKMAASWRHFVPLAFVLTLLALMAGYLTGSAWTWLPVTIGATYIAVSLAISVRMSMRSKCAPCLVTLPLVYAIRHIGYRVGSLQGLLYLALPQSCHRYMQRASNDGQA